MNWLVILYTPILFLLFLPGVVFRLSPKQDIVIVALVHAAAFSLVWYFVTMLIPQQEGFHKKRSTCESQSLNAITPLVLSSIGASQGMLPRPTPSVTPTTLSVGPPPQQTVRGNNGTVTCQRYCQGLNGTSWNGELPQHWNGAKCVGTPENPSLGCYSTSPNYIACSCEKTGRGWFTDFNQTDPLDLPQQNVGGNNGTVSCQRYCQGIGGGPWNGELPKDWNGANCVSTPENPSLGCNSTSDKPIMCRCEKSGAGWL